MRVESYKPLGIALLCSGAGLYVSRKVLNWGYSATASATIGPLVAGLLLSIDFERARQKIKARAAAFIDSENAKVEFVYRDVTRRMVAEKMIECLDRFKPGSPVFGYVDPTKNNTRNQLVVTHDSAHFYRGCERVLNLLQRDELSKHDMVQICGELATLRLAVGDCRAVKKAEFDWANWQTQTLTEVQLVTRQFQHYLRDCPCLQVACGKLHSLTVADVLQDLKAEVGA